MEALLELLDADRPRSGAELGATLGISRAAVWKQIQALRAAGVDIVAERRHGYRLAKPVQRIDARRLQQRLAQAGHAVRVEACARIDSTNSELWRRQRAGERGPLLLSADWQSAGRGRHQRRWLTPYGGQLCLSLLWSLDSGLAALSALGPALGVAAWRGLAQLGVHDVRLKWPNDLVRADGDGAWRKLGGILVEVSGELGGSCSVVAGIGINLRLPVGFDCGQPACDLSATGLDRQTLAETLAIAWAETMRELPRQGAAIWHQDWARADALAGCRVGVDGGAGVLEGTAEGISSDGRLRLRRGDGELVLLSAGEVSRLKR